MQEGSGVFGEEAAGDFHLVIQLGACEQLEAGAESAALGVVSSIDEARYTRLDNRTSAHGAGLERDVQNGSGEAVVAQKPRGFTKHDDFSVSRGVIIANGAIAGARQNRIVLHEHGPDGDFAGGGRSAGFVESKLQKVKVVGHARNVEKSLTHRTPSEWGRWEG